MKLTIASPAKSLNKAFQKQRITREQIDYFKANLHKLFGRINENESEEHLKNIVADFFKDTYYQDRHYINTKERTDLVIHNGKLPSDSVGVIVETKKPSNIAEMLSKKEANTKALHELLLYYLRERIDGDNHEIKYLIATNIYEWFIFDAVWFEKNVYRNVKLCKEYEEWKVSGHDTKYFYENIAKKYIEAVNHELACTYFNLKEYWKIINDKKKADDNRLVELYKILSPEHLLKKPFANDSNSLNKEFYNELLHILGLQENKEGGKKLIDRKPVAERNEGFLVENTYHNLIVRDRLKHVDNLGQYGDTEEDQIFSIALELCLTWLNRILFLKLLEGQLVAYHKGDPRYSFLNSKRISTFVDLNELFFEVLALPAEKRSPSAQKKFGDLPYLNSSLFEETVLESSTFVISELKERHQLPIYSGSILKDTKGKRIIGTKNSLQYLFEFLEAYDFSSEGKEVIQEQNKSIINASVLGLIFEKINGYKDGSYFTPGFITMYMCRETLRKAVVKKFQDANIKSYQKVKTFDDLKDAIEYADKEKRIQANEIINSIKVCDPAVGSGHFLVSALNELIAIKNDLRILNYRDGSRIKGYKIVIENDELIIVSQETDELFEYTLSKNNKPIEDLQTLQEALFHEKQTLIENCLFGVDINPKSVMICRLRLWIELLKHSYYTKESKYQSLETLPNIDINIKCGNSLISRFDPHADLSDIFKEDKTLLGEYRLSVAAYKNSTSKDVKKGLQNLIDSFKQKIVNKFYINDPLNKKLSKYKGQLVLVENRAAIGNLFEKLAEKDIETDVKKLKKMIEKVEQEIEGIKNNRLYEQAFEWRFEFPEVLDEDGKFLGFDVVIGNPPYDIDFKDSVKEYLKTRFEYLVQRIRNSFLYFIGIANELLKTGGVFSYIVPNEFLFQIYMEKARTFFLSNMEFAVAINAGEEVFEAIVPSCIVVINKRHTKNYSIALKDLRGKELHELSKELKTESFDLTPSAQILESPNATFSFNKSSGKLLNSIMKRTKPFEEYCEDVANGISTSCDEVYLVDSGFAKTNKFEKKYLKPSIRGSHFNKYYCPEETGEFVLYVTPDFEKEEAPNIYRYLNENKNLLIKKCVEKNSGTRKWHLLFRHRDENLFVSPKIIIRQTGDSVIAAIDADKNYYCINSVHIAKMKSEYIAKMLFLIGILNSQLSKFIYQEISQESGRVMAEVKPQRVKQMPIAIASNTQEKKIETLVEKIIAAKTRNPQADTSNEEKQIDVMVYHLYNLTYEEAKIIDAELSEEEFEKYKL
jgi:hypothetical protein